jgi:hypothetical protein
MFSISILGLVDIESEPCAEYGNIPSLPAKRAEVHPANAVSLKAELNQAIKVLKPIYAGDLIAICTQFTEVAQR